MSVPALWSEVNRYGQNGDFTRALKTVNKSKCRGDPGCGEDAAWVRRATPPPRKARRGSQRPQVRPQARGRVAAPRPPAARARTLRATCTSLSPRETGREGEGGLKETGARGTASKLFLMSSPDAAGFCKDVRLTFLRYLERNDQDTGGRGGNLLTDWGWGRGRSLS